ncbi:hypothetical protein Q5H91_02925 [Sphingomonas sp. KR1UV-12]|uniref:Uncharacterized protein n=1 Tax=Sphingomonas aurea TaxID=3063994 RepID=A0ABT9EHQ0_9SPHN|nr:hypothetical protein [Sphingomonas sp. KR1UV-12]MDP1026153.1 hypothetical protein [Sphingomonas sp. KR1UV-12]
MSDPTPQERRDAAATRRRWVSLAEAVAVAGVLIGALTLWMNWSDRRADQADKAATQTAESREKARVELVATVEDGGRSLALKDARHDLSDAVVTFPQALGIAAQRPSGDPAIEAAWFADPLLALTDGGPDDRAGRLPVLVTLRYWDGDTARTATGIYDVVWKTEGRVLRGRTLRLDGLRLRQRGGTQAQLDGAWAREKPRT